MTRGRCTVAKRSRCSRRTSATWSSTRRFARRFATRKRPCREAPCSSTTRPAPRRRPTARWRRRCSTVRRRASMREGPLAELFKATEAAQRQAEREGQGETEQGVAAPAQDLLDAPTVEDASAQPAAATLAPAPASEPAPPTQAPAVERRCEEAPVSRLSEASPRLHR